MPSASKELNTPVFTSFTLIEYDTFCSAVNCTDLKKNKLVLYFHILPNISKGQTLLFNIYSFHIRQEHISSNVLEQELLLLPYLSEIIR